MLVFPASFALGQNPKRPVCGTQRTDGLDVSDHQPKSQWDIVSSSGKRFAFIKASEGVTFKNPDFDADWGASKGAGLVRSAYHYFVPYDDPVQQADFFVSIIGDPQAGDLPPMFDWEDNMGEDNDSVVQRAQIFLDRVQAATGVVPIIYTYPSYWHELGDPQGFDRYPLFIADYSDSCPDVPSPWKNWLFWQYSLAPSAGITGIADLDYFNGDLASLQMMTVRPRMRF